MNGHIGQSVEEVYQDFILAKTAEGVSDVTIRNYHQHLHNISKYLDIEQPIAALSKRDLESMVCGMRAAGLAHNSISTYVRVFRTFLNWCQREGRADLTIPNMKDKETVKETYTDEELSLLLEKPKSDCSFAEYRNWVIINFLLNSGCRAATVRNMADILHFMYTFCQKLADSPFILCTVCRETRLRIMWQPGFWYIQGRKCGESRAGTGRSISKYPTLSALGSDR